MIVSHLNRIRILHLEDLAEDAELVEWHLRKGDFDFEILLVDNRQSYIDALYSYMPDIIISDHSLPSFNSVEALSLKKAWNPSIPFILVTATVSEEFAVLSMKGGASDYILKDRLERLPSSVINCIEKFRAEQEKMKVQKQLLESRANLKAILDNTNTGYVLISTELMVVSFNQRAFELAQLQVGRPLTSGCFAPDFFRDGRKDQVSEILNNAMSGKKIEYEISYPQKDGTFRWFSVSYARILDGENKVLGVIMSVNDINSRKLAELEKDLITTDLIKRNSAMEQFSYIVSHNLRAPVSSILGLEYLLHDGSLSEEENKEVHKALTVAASNLDTIVRDLNEILQVTQYTSENLTDVFIAELIEDIELALEGIIKKNKAKLLFDFASLITVKTVRSCLYSILHNLIVNSIKFHRVGVPPRVKLTGKIENNMMVLSIKDNGQGIDLNKHEKNLFGLYNTFSSTSSGRGMGLFMVKTQVDLLNGIISVSSKLGEGTEFLVSLPVPDSDQV